MYFRLRAHRCRGLVLVRHLCLVCLFLPLAAASGSEKTSDLSLKTFRGQPWSLDDVRDSKLVVVAFLGTECPLAKLYGPRLQQLHSEFTGKGVAFVGVNSNTQDSVTEIGAYVARCGISFPMIKDVGNKAADLLKAERTPEVFVLDQQRKVRYRGRVDDQYLVGLARDKVSRRDLAIAIEELLADKTVSVARTEAIGCHIGRVKETVPHGEITYSKHIAPIFNSRCVECHRSGEIAPFQLTGYEDVLGWEDTILEVIQENRMPPWFANPKHGTFSNDARLSVAEKRLIKSWVSNGMPEGNKADLPGPPEFVEGWRMAEPDQVIKIRDRPFTVQAEGVVDYQYFEVDPKWDEDRYVVAAEARPENVAVVHHIIAYVIEPGSNGRRGQDRRMLVGYAPGSIPHVLDEGNAIHVKAGSKLVFEMHYTPNGTQQTDLSYIGLKFTDKANVKRLLRGGAAIETKFRIPANERSYSVEATATMKNDQMLLEMTPHMHLRGKAFRYEAIYPGGRREILLDVPNYDFNWQLTYKLNEPKLLKKGTVIKCTATYDNSKHNLVNPNPDEIVGWGDQSDQEMMIGFFTTVPPQKSTAKTASLD